MIRQESAAGIVAIPGAESTIGRDDRRGLAERIERIEPAQLRALGVIGAASPEGASSGWPRPRAWRWQWAEGIERPPHLPGGGQWRIRMAYVSRVAPPLVNEGNDLITAQIKVDSAYVERGTLSALRRHYEDLTISPPNTDGAITTRLIQEGGELLPSLGVGELFHRGISMSCTPADLAACIRPRSRERRGARWPRAQVIR